MTNFAGDTVTVNISYQDAQYYINWARRPAMRTVKEALADGYRRANETFADRVEFTIPRADAEQFIRGSRRAMRLPSGATLSGMIRLALDTDGAAADTNETRAANNSGAEFLDGNVPGSERDADAPNYEADSDPVNEDTSEPVMSDVVDLDSSDTGTDDDHTHEVSRDAGTGEFVSEQYADEHPDTTVTETVPDGEPNVGDQDGNRFSSEG